MNRREFSREDLGDKFTPPLTPYDKETLSQILSNEKYQPLIDEMMRGLGIPREILKPLDPPSKGG